MLIFVYGTLMQGYPNHHLLESSEYLGKCITQDKFTLLTDGIIPYLSRESEADHVFGELYDVHSTDLISLDALESGYGRDEIEVEINKAVYIANAYFKEDKKGVFVVPSGNYRDVISPDDF
jgi:gamma-glutamylcyclotransferase (GGCT)/AIG2-like uncharacterized protein YtfP